MHLKAHPSLSVCHKSDVLRGFHGGDFFPPAAPRATGLKLWIITHLSFFFLKKEG